MDVLVQNTNAPTTISAASALQMVFQEYRPNTQRAYVRVLGDFQRWAAISQLSDLGSLDSLKVLEYKSYLKAEGKKPATINQTMSVLRKVFKILTEFGHIDQNPFKSSIVRNEKVSDISNKGALRVAQLNAMIEANARMEYDERTADLIRMRNSLILRFLYLTAARRGEAANLRWEHLQQDGGFYVAMLPHTKSGTPQRLKLRQELYNEFEEWQEILLLREIETDFAFPSLSFRTMGQAMTGKGINDVVVKLGKAIGVDISAHYLRHTAITLALELGEPLQKVQAYARHASANTTIRYFHDQEILRKNPTDRLPMI